MLADQSGLTEAQVFDLLSGVDVEAVGPFAGQPALVVRLDGATGALPAVTSALPCVVAGVGIPGDVTDGCDVLLTEVDDPPAPWVQASPAAIVDAAAASPAASVALANSCASGRASTSTGPSSPSR